MIVQNKHIMSTTTIECSWLMLQPIYLLSLIVILAATAVGVVVGWLIMTVLLSATIASAVIGAVSVLAFVILLSPNHCTGSSVIPDAVVDFQKKLKVLTLYICIQ